MFSSASSDAASSRRTPATHESEGGRLGLHYIYVLIDFDRLALPDQALGSVVSAAERLGFAGLNVTHPFKQTMIPCLGRFDADAATIGAVSTVVLKDGTRSGHNTDCARHPSGPRC